MADVPQREHWTGPPVKHSDGWRLEKTVAGRQRHAADAFIRSVGTTLPIPTETFASGAYVELANGQRFFDSYRHPVSPWIGAAAVMAYRQAPPDGRRKLAPIIRQWLRVDFTDENLLRQDWITGETLFLRALAFREWQQGS